MREPGQVIACRWRLLAHEFPSCIGVAKIRAFSLSGGNAREVLRCWELGLLLVVTEPPAKPGECQPAHGRNECLQGRLRPRQSGAGVGRAGAVAARLDDEVRGVHIGYTTHR